MKKNTVYENWKSVTDRTYSGELSCAQGVDQLIDLLAESGIKLRQSSHSFLGCSFFCL